MARVNGSKSIQSTRNYRLFGRSDRNRELAVGNHKKLYASMKRYGFLRCFPVVCVRDANKHLVVKDGQHRLAFAEELGLPVHYIVVDVDFDVAEVVGTTVTWKLKDYAQLYATHGKSDYAEGIGFAERHGLPLGTAFALLAGTTTFSNVQNAFREGEFRIREQPWADAVASLYTMMLGVSRELRTARFIEACMAVCRVEEFDADRLLRCAKRCREKLGAYSTRDAYLDMLEEVYNFGQKSLVGLKTLAVAAMRARTLGRAGG